MGNKKTLESMVGLTIKSIEGLSKDSEEVQINTACGRCFVFYHCQDCCEDVVLNDYEGDLSSTESGVIISAEEVTQSDGDEVEGHKYCDDSHTWTFYKIETSKGGLWMRWLGESNGHYSESITVHEKTAPA